MTDFLEANGAFVPVSAITKIYASPVEGGGVFVHCGGSEVKLPLILTPGLAEQPGDAYRRAEYEAPRAVRELLQAINYVQTQPTGAQHGAHIISYAGTPKRPVARNGRHWNIERLPPLS